MASDNIDVSALLQQLEQLKQKKARNIKKLKRKLSKAVVLKQPCTDEEDSTNDIYKASAPTEARNILGEINYTDKAVGPIQSVESEHGSSKLSKVKSETEISNDEIIITKQNVLELTDVCAKTDQDSLVPRKRSASEFQNDDKTVSNSNLNKKTKLYDKSGGSCCETNILSSFKGDCKPTKEPEFSIPDQHDNDKEFVDGTANISGENFDGENHLPTINSKDYLICDNIKLQKGRINLQQDIERENKEINFNACFKENVSSPKKAVPNNTTSDENQNSPNNLMFQNENIKQSIKNCEVFSLNSNSRNNISPVQSKIEVEFDSNVLEVADTEVSFSSLSNSTVIDCNVIEVADTEVLFCPESSPNVTNCDEKKDSSSRVDKHKSSNLLVEKWEGKDTLNEIAESGQMIADFPIEVASFEEVQTTKRSEPHKASSYSPIGKNRPSFNCSIFEEENCTGILNGDYIGKGNEIIETREISSDFPVDVASFEEVQTTEKPQPLTANDCSPVDKTLHCTFSDEENDSTNIINTNDIENFFRSSESDGNECDDTSSRSSVNDTDMINPYTGNKVSDDEDNADNTEDFTSNVEGLVTDSEVIMVPETELFDLANYNNTKVGHVTHNIGTDNATYLNQESSSKNLNASKTEVNSINFSNKGPSNSSKNNDLPMVDKSKINSGKGNDEKEPFSQTEFDSDSITTQDFLKLVDFQQMPFSSDSSRSNEQSEEKNSTSQDNNMKFQCCFQSDICEEVTRLKLCYFNNSNYLFIQHKTWIQVWRQETNCDWVKIFAHQVDDLQLKELCFSQNDNYLVLVLLLTSEQRQHCLQFLVFERESRLIKLMEHTHWFENSETEEEIYLCGLDDLKFASAQGKVAFKVYSHSFSGLEESPRLLAISLGSAADCLHSLCRIDKLPNALLGMSKNMLYVWHILEARLVTSIRLQIEDSVDIESCVWTTIENGLVFMMANYKAEESPNACQLLAANLATGFCEVVLTYTLQPAKECRSTFPRKMALAYSEPFLAAATEDGAFIWSINEEYCCASILSLDYSTIAIFPTQSNSFLIVVGCTGGCVNCFELKYS